MTTTALTGQSFISAAGCCCCSRTAALPRLWWAAVEFNGIAVAFDVHLRADCGGLPREREFSGSRKKIAACADALPTLLSRMHMQGKTLYAGGCIGLTADQAWHGTHEVGRHGRASNVLSAS